LTVTLEQCLRHSRPHSAPIHTIFEIQLRLESMDEAQKLE